MLKTSEMVDLVNRSINAENDFIACVAEAASLTQEQAEHVLAVYYQLKVFCTSSYSGRLMVKHGAYLDVDVLLRAAAYPLKVKKVA